MGKFENKWIRAVIPALLIHCSIGTVYCWSLFKGDIASYIGNSVGEVEWAFSIAIFVLGMSLFGYFDRSCYGDCIYVSCIFYCIKTPQTNLEGCRSSKVF